MNFDLSDDCKAMAGEVRRVLERCCTMDEVRRCLATGRPSERTWRVLAELGVLGAAIPECWGGSGLGELALAACAESIGHACAPVPTLGSLYLATPALLQLGDDDLRARWLPRLARGEVIGSVAFGDLVVDDAGRASGELRLVPGGGQADVLVLLGEGAGGWCVDLRQRGVSRREHAVLDPGYPLADLHLVGVAAHRLSAEPGSASALRDQAAVLLAFEQLGGAERALGMARSHTLTRRTFGRTVASYQAVKHLLADVWCRIEIARGHAYHGAWALAHRRAQLPLAAAGARVAASEAFEFAAQENLQLHGGMGFTWEADCHPLYKRARSTALALGPVRDWKRSLIERLREPLDAPRQETARGL